MTKFLIVLTSIFFQHISYGQTVVFDDLVMHTRRIEDSTLVFYSDYQGNLYDGRIFRLDNKGDTVLKGIIKEGILIESSLWRKKTKKPQNGSIFNKYKSTCVDSIDISLKHLDSLTGNMRRAKVEIKNMNTSINLVLPTDGQYQVEGNKLVYSYSSLYYVEIVQPGQTFEVILPPFDTNIQTIEILLFCDRPVNSYFGRFLNKPYTTYGLPESVYKEWKNIIVLKLQ